MVFFRYFPKPQLVIKPQSVIRPYKCYSLSQRSLPAKGVCPQQKKLFQASEPETVSNLSILLSAASQLLG